MDGVLAAGEGKSDLDVHNYVVYFVIVLFCLYYVTLAEGCDDLSEVETLLDERIPQLSQPSTSTGKHDIVFQCMLPDINFDFSWPC